MDYNPKPMKPKEFPQFGTKEFNDLASAYFGGEPKEMKQSNEKPQTPQLNISDVSGSLYPTDEQILEMVEDFTKDMNVSNTTKKSIQFGFQEGMFKMLEIWKQSNNGR